MVSTLSCSRPCSALIPIIAAALAFPVGAQAADTLKFSPSKLAFGGKALGEASELTAVLKNATQADITILSAKLKGKAGYSFATTCGKVLKAKKKCAYIVKYEPEALASALAVLQVETSDPVFSLVSLKVSGNLYPMLNDTGITQCGGSSAHNKGLACPVKDSPRQDAEYGRDVTANDDADGHAGFSFTKLDSNGKPLPPGAAEWDCVRDNVTGLIWEKKTARDRVVGNQGLHDADDRYTWYSTDAGNNGGFVGTAGTVSVCFGYLASVATLCDTEAYVNRVNLVSWCGFRDWRLPSFTELNGLMDQGVGPALQPHIDQAYFPDGAYGNYWTASPYAGIPGWVWHIDFGYGVPNFASSNFPRSARLVRGGP